MKPSAAKKAGQAAEKAHKEAYGNPEKGENPEVELEVVENNENPEVEQPPVEPNAEEQSPEEQPLVEPPQQDAKFWEQKYKTLQGMYNADIPRLNGQIKELTEKNNSLENTLASINTAPPSFNQEGESFVTDEDIDDYGYDMVDLIKRATKDATSSLEAEIAHLKGENLQLSQSMGKVNAESEANSRQHVFDALAQQMPDWSQINVDPEFLEWLAESDTLAGQPRQNLLNQAFENHDAPRVIAFFKQYVADRNLVTGQGNQTDTPSPTVNLDTLVAPGKPQQTGNVAPTEDETTVEIWSNAEVQRFYADVQKGKYRNNPKEKEALERRIHKAATEGRLR